MKRFLGFVVACAAFLAANAAVAEPYRLNDQDKLFLRVGQWNQAAGAFEYWDGLSGEYTVSSDGRLSILVAGSVVAEGRTVAEVGNEIALRLQREIGMPAPPRISLEVVSYKPIHVAGAVSNPGAYAYQIGMTVQQAIAVAGGPPRGAAADTADNRQAISLRGEIERHALRIAGLELEEARLAAEIAAYEANATPQTDGTDASRTIQESIMLANQNAIDAQLASIRDLQSVLREQIRSLGKEITLRDQQIAIVTDQLAKISDLKERGLTVNTRVQELESRLNDNEAKRIQLEVARLTAEQQLNLAERDESSLFDQARLRRLADLRNVQSDLADLNARIETARALYSEALAWDNAAAPALELPQPEYRVTRDLGDDVEIIEMALTDRLVPGDTLQVTIGGTLGYAN